MDSSSSSVICQTTGPKPLPKRFLHIVQSRVSSFNWQYPVLSLRSPSSFLRLLPRLLVTSTWFFIFPSITFCRRQFLRKMWPIQLAFRFLISCRIFLCTYRTIKTVPHFLLNKRALRHISIQREVYACLEAKFPSKWIRRGGAVPWISCSPHLTPLDFRLWRFVKDVVCIPATPTHLRPLRQHIRQWTEMCCDEWGKNWTILGISERKPRELASDTIR